MRDRDLREAADLYLRLSQQGRLVSQSIFKFAAANYHLGTLSNASERCAFFRKAAALFDEYGKREPSDLNPASRKFMSNARDLAAACGR